MTPITMQSLAGYQVAPDGTHCRLCFIDSDGVERPVEISVQCFHQLILAMAKMAEQPTPDDHGEAPLAPAHVVKSWKVCSGLQGQVIFTFLTQEGHSIRCEITGTQLEKFAEATIEYELEAFPEGLSLPRNPTEAAQSRARAQELRRNLPRFYGRGL